MSRFIYNTVYAFFFALLGLITYSLSRIFISTFFNYAWYSYIFAAFLIIGIFGLFILLFKKFDTLCKTISSSIGRLSACKLAIILAAVCLITKVALIFVFQSDCNVHIDMGKYISFADQIAHNGIVTEHSDYASYHPYTLLYGLFLSPIAYFFGTNSLAYEVVLAILMTITMVLLFDILQKFAGKTTAFVGILLYNLIPMGLMQPQVVVHETPLLFFHILSFWFLLRIFDSKHKPVMKLVFVLLCAVSIIIGTCLNLAGNIIMIALAIFSFVKIISTENNTSSKKKIIFKKSVQILSVLLCLVVCLSMCTIITDACVDRFITNPPDNNFEEKKIPMGWVLYVGSNYETNGTISGKDKEIFNHYRDIDDVEEAKQYQLDLIKERYSFLLSSPKRIFIHLYKKLTVLWSPYFAFRGNPESPGYQSFASMAGGIGRLAMLGITYLSYVIFYLMTLIGVYNKKERAKKDKSPILHFMLVPVGVTLALIMLEVLAKYSSHAHILIFAVGILNFRSFRANMSAIRGKLLPKSKKTCKQ